MLEYKRLFKDEIDWEIIEQLHNAAIFNIQFRV